MLWGLSESQDLLAKYIKSRKIEGHPSELNILLFGAGDIRHVIETVANHQTSGSPCQLNFYILDGCVNVLARNILLLDIVLSSNPLSCLGRTHLFMDIYGNTLNRPSSADYQRIFAESMIPVIAGGDVATAYSPILDLDGLRYRERDLLVDILSFWRSPKPFGVAQQWNTQLRNYLGQRYDSRKGAFDFDLYMELKYRGAERISGEEYHDFRESGIAFHFPEFEYGFENKTMAVQGAAGWRLLSDMHTGPYPAFGLHCEDEEMLKESKGSNFYRSTDITERNLLKLMTQIQEKTTPSFDSLRKTKLGLAKLTVNTNPTAISGPESTVERRPPRKLICVERLKLNFLGPEFVLKLAKTGRFQNFFDVVFIGAGCFKYLDDAFEKLIRTQGLVIIELLQLSLLPKESRSKFSEQVKEFARASGLRLLTKLNVNKHYTTYDYIKIGQ